MTLKLIYSTLLLAVSTALFAQKSPIIVDKIVAQIGDEIILLSDLQAQKLQMAQAGTEIPANADCDILEGLMYQNLLLNQAMLDSITLPPGQVESEMENRLRVIEQQIGGREKLEQFYGKTVSQIKLEFYDIIEDRLLTQEVERVITEDLSVTPKEVKAFYDKIPSDSIPFINATIGFQQIVIYPKITDKDKKLAYDKLVEISKLIAEGKSFDTQARINSNDPGSAKDGGKIKATRGMMVPQFEATVFSLKENEVSKVFETDYGYHIVKLLERKGDDYTCQHILIIPEFSSDELQGAAMKMDSCYNELNAKTITWDEAVVKYSNDEETMQNKGVITDPRSGEQEWSTENLNEIDQQIYILTNTLKVGEHSSPSLYANIYDGKQGIRIVRIMSKTEPHKANLDQDYALIKRAAENEKRELTLQNWTQDKIGNAYVKIDDEYKNCNFTNKWILQ
jgi:peptidyl-prolyl cis-trans isomerase SurA